MKKLNNHSHFWIDDEVLYESYTTIRGLRYMKVADVPGMPNEEKCSEACIKYLKANYLKKQLKPTKRLPRKIKKKLKKSKIFYIYWLKGRVVGQGNVRKKKPIKNVPSYKFEVNFKIIPQEDVIIRISKSTFK